MENPLLEEGTVDAATMDQVEGSLAAFRQGLEEGFGRIASSAQHLKEVTTQVDAAGRRLEQSLRGAPRIASADRQRVGRDQKSSCRGS